MLDNIDLRILRCLQEDASLSTAEVAESANLSKTPCWRRIQRLEAEGIISKRVALLDRERLQRSLDVFVTVRTRQHNADWSRAFCEVIEGFPEVVEFYRMSGNIDYLMRVVVENMREYDAFYQRLIERIDLDDVSSNFAMERIKYTTAIPL